MNNSTLVAFLRGVMLSGKNAVKMTDVRAVLIQNLARCSHGYKATTPLHVTAGLANQDFGAEKLHICPHAAYSYIPQDTARSKLSNTFPEKKLGFTHTTRNGNTLRKMVDF